tara:strand:+ start:217 stop:447 length:231 start_codon:yes stop_codon:yes gene_type:complete
MRIGHIILYKKKKKKKLTKKQLLKKLAKKQKGYDNTYREKFTVNLQDSSGNQLQDSSGNNLQGTIRDFNFNSLNYQ